MGAVTPRPAAPRDARPSSTPAPAPSDSPAAAQARDRRPVVAFVADLGAVLLFAGIGRASHEEDAGLLAAAGVAWPFWVGTAAGWVAARGWRAPAAVRPTGLAAWVGTVAVGIALRAATGGGVRPSFVVVTAVVTGAFLLGWRGLTALVERRARRRRP